MKFKFKIHEYQTEAVNAVVDVFKGQPFNDRVKYTRDLGVQATPQQISMIEGSAASDVDEIGFGNAEIVLTDEQLLSAIKNIQAGNNIKQSKERSTPFGQTCRCALDIEMETGTGKTYVYIKTMFELNKRYGWSKFIVIVPSVAIREGVFKSFKMTEDHFFEQYGKKARYFVYNSKNLNELDNFSSDKKLNVMIINSQAFASSMKEGARNDASRIIYNEQDNFASRRPIDVIAANRPIIILDEPQKLSGDATTEGIKRFKPLFSLNYSATHKQAHNLVYVLDALDAYQKKLVKKIEVKGFELRDLKGTQGFVYFSDIKLDHDKPPEARIIFEVRHASGIKREARTVRVNDDLYALSGRGKNQPINQYKDGYVIKQIDPIRNELVFLNGITLKPHEAIGDVNEADMRRIQIRETIRSHFEKEEKLFNKEIKCLSLFFIDEVKHYRQYDEQGNELLGDFGVMFEEEYNAVFNEYNRIDETPYIKYLKSIDVKDTHKGYFSIDKGRAVNSKTNRKGESDDISAYDLILKDKERLLSFDEPTRFIFSHSALREGWDNPNVFQICTLKQSNDSVGKRQEVGRGMRLCVDQTGNRMDWTVLGAAVQDINKLTVIASDSYKDFVSALQSEIKETLYDRPPVASKEYFVGKIVRASDNTPHILDKNEAAKIERWLIYNQYIDFDGKLTDKFRADRDNQTLQTPPDELAQYAESIHKLIQGVYDEKAIDSYVNPGDKPKIDNKLNEDNFFKKEFQALWNHINHKYAYTVEFDSAELIEKSIAAINAQLKVAKTTYTRTTGMQSADGLQFVEGASRTEDVRAVETSMATYDLVGEIAKRTDLTRKTSAKILSGIGVAQFLMFKSNPEEFMDKVGKLINEQKATLIVEEISYDAIDGKYDSDIFTASKVNYDPVRVLDAKRHVTPWVICDSEVERKFAEKLEKSEDGVCVYAKLPKTFVIPTPVGNYTPDWAISFVEGSVKYVYFVAETKGSLESLQLKKIEAAKIACAKKLFAKLDGGKVKYDVADTYESLLNIVKG